MIIRISGGNSGIKEYLENGQKQDRYFSRDDLDQRVILNGDLEIADTIINNIPNAEIEKDRYLHITISFKEDSIATELLENISNEFREFYFKAYSDDELCFYSEAHLPKIKSYRHASDDTFIYRKPHIHIVVPKINLLTGHVINPYIPSHIPYINAFQEHINAKYGLESPKDNSRFKINEASEFISRYKGDGFKGKNYQIRQQIFDEILNNNIISFDELGSHLEQSGYVVKVRNQGKGRDKEYYNIIDKEGTSINLRDKVFQGNFLELAANEKINNLKQDIEYLEPQDAVNDTKAEHLSLLLKWEQYKGDEYKYVQSKVGAKEFTRFSELDIKQKIEYINLKKQQHKLKYKIGGTYDESRRTDYTTGDGTSESINYQQEHLNNAEQNIRAIDTTLATLSADNKGVEHDKISAISREQRFELARRYARIIEQDQSNYGRDFNPYNSSAGDTSRTDRRHNVVDTHYQLLLDKVNLSRADFKLKARQFNSEIQGNVLLELLEKTHGVNPELYRITKGFDGSDRIGCGSRNLTLLDFCTREMHLSLVDSFKLLTNALNMQLDVNREKGWSHAQAIYLSKQYKSWFKEYKIKRAGLLKNTNEYYYNKRREIISKFDMQIKSIKDIENKTPFWSKREQVSLLRMDKLLELEALQKAKQVQAISLRSKYNLEMQKAYKVFLSEQAEQGDELALTELRRLRIEFEDVTKTDSFNYVDRYQEFKLNIVYKIDSNGTINYTYEGKVIAQDYGKRVVIGRHTDDNIKLILDLAMQKFGTNITLTGSDKFRKKAVDLAIKNNYKINFTDKFSETYYNQRVQELKLEGEKLRLDKERLLQANPKMLYVSKIVRAESISQTGRYLSQNVVQVTDPATKKEYNISGYKVNFAASKLVPGQFVEVVRYNTHTGDISLKSSTFNKEVRKLEVDIISQHRLEFIEQIKKDYGDSASFKEYTGKLIKSGESSGKFYILMNINGKFTRIWNNEIKKELTKLGINSGNYISCTMMNEKAIINKLDKGLHTLINNKLDSILNYVQKEI